ncbi:cytochrome c nitrite reductase pentaheme subunit [Conservatibacter flavescens]|uniref:Cytochrome c nitrite reductase pentaheme subunit n=1 Tax=Conservatibacter flavescens TaxID=28161 RepID=A0A2M8S1Z1_9PAST|nr:cytochrome c nitrite reductase pentaheme subunit [Conservatibacter flavescens]PJG85147.1 cytochrome c nitrite reductase pentaheme subunit [Conservatibacter flavescens]
MSLHSILIKGNKLLALLIGVVALGLPLIGQAEKVAESENKAVSPLVYEPELENQRDPNQYCAQCHKFDGTEEQSGGVFHAGKFHGIHLSKNSPITGKQITCVNCHGNISEDHRRGAKDVMRFEGDIFSDKQPMYTAQEQNQVCFACHQPKKLQEKLWAHDVHAMKLPCASCHTLHPEKDAMSGIEKKEQVKLCVDCHGKQLELKEQGKPLTEHKDGK